MDRRHAQGSSKARLEDFRRNPARDDGHPVPSPDRNGKPKTSAKPQARKKYLRDYARWLWPYRWALAGVFAIYVIVIGLDAIWPLLIKNVMDLINAQVSDAEKLRRLNVL